MKHALFLATAILVTFSAEAMTPEVFNGTYMLHNVDGSSCKKAHVRAKDYVCENPNYQKYTKPHQLILGTDSATGLMTFAFYAVGIPQPFMQFQYPFANMTYVEQEVGLPYTGYELKLTGTPIISPVYDSDDGLFQQQIVETPVFEVRLVRFSQTNGVIDHGVEIIRTQQTRVTVFAVSRDDAGTVTERLKISDNIHFNPLAVELAVQYLIQ